MLQSEFIERTHYYPTGEEYRRIEEEYNAFEGDKDAYCKMWKRKHLESASQRAVHKVLSLEMENAKLRNDIEKLNNQTTRLREERNAWIKEARVRQASLENLQVNFREIKSMLYRIGTVIEKSLEFENE